jgi:hypothetical protein
MGRRASRGRSLEERLEEGERRALLKAMGVEIWRLRDSDAGAPSAEGNSSVGAASTEAPPSVGAVVGAASAADTSAVGGAASGDSSVGAASAGGASAANTSAANHPPTTSEQRSDVVPRCEIHAYKLGRVLALVDPGELTQQNRRLFQDLVRAAGGDPDRQADPTEFVWPPAEGSLFDAGQDAALAAFVKRLRGRTANVVTLCVGESVCEIAQGLDLGVPVVFAGALQTLRTGPDAKRNLWQALQGTFEA